MVSELPTVPVQLRVHLAHATLQAIADRCGVKILHIKGPTASPSLRALRFGPGVSGRSSQENRESVDADILVLPSHLRRLLRVLPIYGWQEVTWLESGGLVEHSTNWYHPELGQVDIHVRFPGFQIPPEHAFECLWRSRSTQEVAHWRCTVPGDAAQRLIMLLHAARNMQTRSGDIAVAWRDATSTQQKEVRSLAHALRADVALAAAIGDLEDYRDRPEYGLWRSYSRRIARPSGARKLATVAKAVPGGFGHLRIARYVLSLFWSKRRRMAVELGRNPTVTELLVGYRSMLRRGVRELWALVRR